MQTPLFKYRFSHCSQTDRGRVRAENQDVVIPCPYEGFFAVVDGMGGLAEGGETSRIISLILPQMVVDIAKEAVRRPPPRYRAAADLIDLTVREVSDTIYAMTNEGRPIGFGATICGVWLVDDKAVFINLGDSRGYLLRQREGTFRQVTTDHNRARQLVDAGRLTEEEARFHRAGSFLTRYAGMPAPALPDLFFEDVRPGDRILICSDGLHGMAGDDTISSVLAGPNDETAICEHLVALANENGGMDNIAVAVMQVEDN